MGINEAQGTVGTKGDDFDATKNSQQSEYDMMEHSQVNKLRLVIKENRQLLLLESS